MIEVSVIMPCHNAARFVRDSIGSVLSQTFQHWELVVVDDGSSDATPEILESLRDPRIRVIRQPNRGVSAARNTGIAAARGLYLAFLDADDSWHPDFLRAMGSALRAAGKAAVAYCGWRNVGLGVGRDAPFIPPDYEGPHKLASLLESCRWPVHAAMLPKDLAIAAGGFDTEQTSAEDFDFWLRVATVWPVIRVPQVLAFYHHHGQGQMSEDRLRAARFRLRAIRKFLRQHPEAKKLLGRTALRNLIWGPTLTAAYEAYWGRDLATARPLFRLVLRHLYGTPRDWVYMLPALLPQSWHRAALNARWSLSGNKR